MSENESREGERENERKEAKEEGRGGAFVQTPLPMGPCVSV